MFPPPRRGGGGGGGGEVQTREKRLAVAPPSPKRPGASNALKDLVRMAGIHLAGQVERPADAVAGATGSTFQPVAAVKDGGNLAPVPCEDQEACTTAELVGAINAALVGTFGVDDTVGSHRGSVERALKRWCDAEQLDSNDGASVVVAAAAVRDVALCSDGRRMGARPALEWVLPPPGDASSAQTCLRVLAGCVSKPFPGALSNFVLGSKGPCPTSFEDPAFGSILGVCLIALRFVCSRMIGISSLLESYEDHPLLPYLISALDSGANSLAGPPGGNESFLLASAARILASSEQRASLREAWGGVSVGYLLKIFQRFMDAGDMGAVRKIAGNSDVKRLCFSEDARFTDLLLQWLDEYAINSETPRLQEGSLAPFPPRVVLSFLLSQPFDPTQCSRSETAETVVHVLETVGKEATAAERLHMSLLVRELILAHAIERGVEPGEAMRAATSLEVGSPANLTDVEKCIVAAILCFVVNRPGSCEAYSSMLGALGSGPIEYMLLLTSQILSSLAAGDGCPSILLGVQKCCFPFAAQLGCEGLQRLAFESTADCRPRNAYLEFVTRCVLDRKVFSKQNLFAGTVLGQIEAMCDRLEKGGEGVAASARGGERARAEPAAEDRAVARFMVDLLHPVTLNMYLPVAGQARPALDLKTVQRFGKAMMRIMKFAPAHRVDLGNDAGVPMGSEEPPRGSAAWALDADDELPLALRIGTIVKEVVLIHALSEGSAVADASQAIFGTRVSPMPPRESKGPAQAGAVPVWVHRLVQECMGSQVVLGTVSADARPAPLLLDPQGPVAAAEKPPPSRAPADHAEAPSGGGADGVWGAFEVHCGRSHSHRNGVAGPLEDLACVPRSLRGSVKVKKSELFFAK